MYKRLTFILLTYFCFIISAEADSINPAVYKNMRTTVYRSPYNRNVTNSVVPYWQAQSNYMTRGNLYRNYSDYYRYTHGQNSTTNQYRR